MRIVVAVAHRRPRNYANLSTIKVSNSSFLAYGFSVWFVNRQEIKRLELVYLESFLFELLETSIQSSHCQSEQPSYQVIGDNIDLYVKKNKWPATIKIKASTGFL